MKNFSEYISNQIKQRRIAFFVGAGISYNSGLPLASEIIKCILAKIFNSIDYIHDDSENLFEKIIQFESFVQNLSDSWEAYNDWLFYEYRKSGKTKGDVTKNNDGTYDRTYLYHNIIKFQRGILQEEIDSDDRIQSVPDDHTQGSQSMNKEKNHIESSIQKDPDWEERRFYFLDEQGKTRTYGFGSRKVAPFKCSFGDTFIHNSKIMKIGIENDKGEIEVIWDRGPEKYNYVNSFYNETNHPKSLIEQYDIEQSEEGEYKVTMQKEVRKGLTKKTNEHLLELLDLFKSDITNSNHLLIAYLAKHGFVSTIFTTNFDCLLEKALEKVGLKEIEDFVVLMDENHYEKVELDKVLNKILLVKLHGSLIDEASVITTIKGIKNGGGKGMKKILEYLYRYASHDSVVVMGYSCSDRFDITPLIREIDCDRKKIFLIHHEENAIGEPMNMFKSLDRMFPFQDFSGEGMKYDIDLLCKSIWENCLNDPEIYDHIKLEGSWEAKVNEWFNKYMTHEDILYYLLAKIYIDLNDFVNVERCMLKCIEVTEDSDNYLIRMRYCFLTAQLYQKCSYLSRATEFYEKVISIATKHRQLFEKFASIANIGLVEMVCENYEKALKYMSEACEYFEKIGKRDTLKMLYENTSRIYLILGNQEMSNNFYNKILSLN